jgi:4-hydroxybutyrate CoA-transferase
MSFEEAAQQVKSGDFISIAIGVGACSSELYEAIINRHDELRNVKIMDAIQLRPTRLYDPEFMKNLDGQINYAPGFGIQPFAIPTQKTRFYN